MSEQRMKLVAQNKKAAHDYFFEELFEAGIELAGTEVKSLRMGKCSLKESFIRIQNGEAYILNMHISPYEKGNIFNRDPVRTRKLLLHKNEIRKLIGAVKADGYTIIPVSYTHLDVYKRQPHGGRHFRRKPEERGIYLSGGAGI